MNINLEELLPKEISEEIAFCMERFMVNLALVVNSYYFVQKKRRCEECNDDRYDDNCGQDPF